MSGLQALIQDLVIANRILAREDVVDAYGHVSVRHPDNPHRFLIARSLAPLDLDGAPVREDGHKLYLERFIHAAIFAARPDVMAVVHAHAEDTLPFGIAPATKLRPVIHAGSFIGGEVPVWDIADRFGDTNLLVVWSQALMVHYFLQHGGRHCGPGSSRQRHDDSGDPSSDTE